ASAAVTYFTSRGIGMLEVNYGGSSGYGRAYRERLPGQWSIVDVDDDLTAAHGLADAALADPARLAVRGGSAGGWTVLTALARAPLTHADRIDVPVLLLQGTDDAVVPPSQSERIRDALAARGVEHEYLLFEGEGHGFRRAETIIAALEAELGFLGRVFGFAP